MPFAAKELMTSGIDSMPKTIREKEPQRPSTHFAQARAQLKLVLGDKPGNDQGEFWNRTYQAETRQCEAEALFQAKGIPLSESDAR